MNYSELKQMIEESRSHQANHAWLKKSRLQVSALLLSNGDIAVRLVDSNIMVFHPNGWVTLDTCGWQTATTKARMNDYLPKGWGIYQEKGIWYLSTGYWNDPDRKVYAFNDGLTFNPETGVVIGAANVAEIEYKQKRLKKYVKKYIEQMYTFDEDKRLPAPSGGDCWYCALAWQGDDFGGDGHVWSHVDEGYYVPTLMAVAMKEKYGDYANYIPYQVAMAILFHQEPGNQITEDGPFIELSKDAARKALMSYMKMKIGLAA